MSKQAAVEGLAAMRANMEALKKDIGPELATAAVKGARLVQSSAIKSIKSQSAGEEVTRQHSGQAPYQHIASKPGDAPNTDTGELIRGIQVEVQADAVLVGVESSQDIKANTLEFGTEDGTTILPRPFLFPALEENRETIKALLAQAVVDSIERTGKDAESAIRKLGKSNIL